MKKIPLHSLVVMVGPSGAGKSTIIENHFSSYETVSSDAIRAELTGDFQRQDLNHTVFRELFHRVTLKLDIGERVIVDATNLRKNDRMGLTQIGQKHGVPVFYVVVDRPLDEKLKTQGWRADHAGLVERHHELFQREEKEILRGDHIATVIDTRTEEFDVINKIQADNMMAEIKARGFNGVMAIADVHGKGESLKSAIEWAQARNLFIVFLGDVVDYGPDSIECVNMVYNLVTRGRAVLVIGNHEFKIQRWLDQVRKGEVKLKLSEGNRATTRAIEALNSDERRKFECRFGALMGFARHHWVIGNTMFVHGAAEPEMFDINTSRLAGRYSDMAMFGEVDSIKRFRDDGYPNRIYEWVNRIPAGKQVLVGHDIRSQIKPLEVKGSTGGSAVFLDTGSGKGGRLTTADLTFTGEILNIQSFTAH